MFDEIDMYTVCLLYNEMGDERQGHEEPKVASFLVIVVLR